MEEAGVYESEDEMLTEEQLEVREKAGMIRAEKAIIRHKHRLNKHRFVPFTIKHFSPKFTKFIRLNSWNLFFWLD